MRADIVSMEAINERKVVQTALVFFESMAN